MTSAEYSQLADLHRLRAKTREAVKLVLVDGRSNYAAAQQTGVAASTIGRVLSRFDLGKCPHCGHPLH